MATEIVLSGSGTPVQMNPWTGDVTPVDFEGIRGGVKVRLTLAHRDAAILALLPQTEPVKTRQWGETVALDEFDTTILSWGPDPEAAVPTQSQKTPLALDGVKPVLGIGFR